MERSPLPAVMVIFILTSGCMANAPDLDGDGIQDSEDLDIDGDGWDNDMELNCLLTLSPPPVFHQILMETWSATSSIVTMMGIFGGTLRS